MLAKERCHTGKLLAGNGHKKLKEEHFLKTLKDEKKIGLELFKSTLATLTSATELGNKYTLHKKFFEHKGNILYENMDKESKKNYKDTAEKRARLEQQNEALLQIEIRDKFCKGK